MRHSAGPRRTAALGLTSSLLNPLSLAEMRMINEQLSGTYPRQYGGGRQNADACRCRAQRAWLRIAIQPVNLLGAAVTAMREALRTLKATSQEANSAASLDELNTLVDFESIWALDERR